MIVSKASDRGVKKAQERELKNTKDKFSLAVIDHTSKAASPSLTNKVENTPFNKI